MKIVDTFAAVPLLALAYILANTLPGHADTNENRAFVIRSSTGRCLDVHQPEANSDGGRVQVWTCNGQPQQLWIRSGDRGRSLRNAAGNLCLSALGVNVGDPLRVRACTFGGGAQKWHVDSSRMSITLDVLSIVGICIDAHAPDRFFDGGRVQLGLCNGEPQQKWTLVAPSEVSREAVIRTSAGLCLDVDARAVERNGAPVQVWACNGQAQQRWAFDRNSRAVRVASGLCLDVDAPAIATNGGRVQVWACNGQAQQQWIPSSDGSLRNAGGLCLDVHAPDQTKNGGRVQVWQCNNQQQQHFASSAF
jgi:hypothetical protein